MMRRRRPWRRSQAGRLLRRSSMMSCCSMAARKNDARYPSPRRQRLSGECLLVDENLSCACIAFCGCLPHGFAWETSATRALQRQDLSTHRSAVSRCATPVALERTIRGSRRKLVLLCFGRVSVRLRAKRIRLKHRQNVHQSYSQRQWCCSREEKKKPATITTLLSWAWGSRLECPPTSRKKNIR